MTGLSCTFTEDLALSARPLQVRGPRADTPRVNFATCPYDGEDVSAEAFAGGFLVISCEHCGAAWELHNQLLRRIHEPDREVVRQARRTSRGRREQSAAAEMLAEVAAELALDEDATHRS